MNELTRLPGADVNKENIDPVAPEKHVANRIGQCGRKQKAHATPGKGSYKGASSFAEYNHVVKTHVATSLRQMQGGSSKNAADEACHTLCTTACITIHPRTCKRWLSGAEISGAVNGHEKPGGTYIPFHIEIRVAAMIRKLRVRKVTAGIP